MYKEPFVKNGGRMSGDDSGHRLLFSYPQMIEDLIRGFIHEDWVSRLDFKTLERVSGSFVSEDLKDRHNDLIWRVRWEGDGEEGWFYVYLLLEFQAAPDPFMPVRMLVYVGLLLQLLIRTLKLGASDKLPPILPILFYSGKRPWKVPLDLESLFTPVPGSLRRWLPRLDYVLIDENRLSPEERDQARNLVAALARLETSIDPEHFSEVARNLAQWLPPGDLRRVFTAWVVRVVRRTFRGATIPLIEDLEEVPMLEETLREWQDRARREGQREGREEGLKGSRRIVLRLIERRFGKVPKHVKAQIDAISSIRELEKIADKVMTAPSLADMGLG
ncbi:MAG TPA: Rpn family recombination-promoting nuclease/putative transposase [Thermoanaerobaculia bacterium]